MACSRKKITAATLVHASRPSDESSKAGAFTERFPGDERISVLGRFAMYLPIFLHNRPSFSGGYGRCKYFKGEVFEVLPMLGEIKT